MLIFYENKKYLHYHYLNKPTLLFMIKIHKKISIICLIFIVLSSCTNSDNDILDEGGEALYQRGIESMADGNYPTALAYFQALEANYPFSNLTRQAQLDIIYVYYKSSQPELAIDAAEEFERENPTHPRVDYCLYIIGLSYFDESPNFLERWFSVDLDIRPPKNTLQAFQSFQELLRRFPNSQYAPDARERMIFLRNRLAAYENHVAEYYIRRGAYLAAINRAKYALEHYSGSPELEISLTLMINAYEMIGMNNLASDARRILDENFPSQ
ncbi:MAG: outer membrane protein assembly factor BamD [Gammaproteobacteria bacterium]|nr:outer membrane protein assembly factor BamD [Gammaproteobacteria bacterium]